MEYSVNEGSYRLWWVCFRVMWLCLALDYRDNYKWRG